VTRSETDVRRLPAAAVLAEIRARSQRLVPSEARIVAVILADPDSVVLSSARDLAAAAGTSTTTVVRCCRNLGFSGYQDLRLALARTAVPAELRSEPITPDDGPADVLGKVVAIGASAVAQSVMALDVAELKRAIDLMRAARRVLFVGIGTAAPLAMDAAYRFRHIGVEAEAPQDTVMQRIVARQLDQRDVCVALSHAGAAPATLAAARQASAAGAPVIAVTSFHGTPLALLADVLLVAGSQEQAVRVEAMASRLVHLTILDTMFMGVVQAGPGNAQAAMDGIQDMLEQDVL
jgi:DNA-binding MurR/RpiR family transcriptional regulator